MASRWRGKAEFREGFLESETPRFFKIVSSMSLDRGKIAIPQKFIRQHRHHFSDSVLLKAPSGEKFEVRVEEFEGKVWLGNGWRKFQDHYSLVNGSLILFELEGRNVLRVLIFDFNGLEVDYPVKCSHEETGDDYRTDSYPSDSELPIETDHSSSSYSLTMQSELEPESESECEPECSRHRKRTLSLRKEESKSHSSQAGKRPQIVKLPLPPSSHKAKRAAERFKTERPTFLVRLLPSYMRSGGMSINGKFMTENNFKFGEGLVKLKHRGKCWPVKMLCYRPEHRGKLCRGFGKFLKDNSLLNGDVCVFELMKSDEFVVHFFRCVHALDG